MNEPPFWNCYDVVLAAESPLHLGWHSLGLIRRTRYYIPARTIWGLLVARLAPALARGYDGSAMYQEARRQLANAARCTCFFPLLQRQGQEDEWLLPRFTSRGLCFGGLPAAEFERTFVSSLASAALEARTLTAEQGALHDSEALAPVGANRERLCFRGYILLRQGISLDAVAGVLRACSVGGDRRYGWGRLRLLRGLAQPCSDLLFGTFRVHDRDSGEGPVLAVEPPGAFTLPAHLECDTAAPEELEGDIEVVSGRDWEAGTGSGSSFRAGSGQSFPPARVCWAPGTVAAGRTVYGGRFRIGAEGIWEKEAS